MIDSERINYRNLYKDVADYIDYVPQPFVKIPQQEKIELPVSDEKKPSSFVLLLKKIVKRTVPGRLILLRRRRKRVRELLICDETKPCIDVSFLLELEDIAFLAEAFLVLLNRRISHDEFIGFYTMIKTGMPKKALIYILCNSTEKDPNVGVEDLLEYEKAYYRYIIKRKLVNLPVLNYFILLFGMPVRLRRIEHLLVSLDINAADRFNGEIHCIQSAENNIINHLKER